MDEHKTSENTSNLSVVRVSGMYKDWFLDYASYVILERAIPAMDDGLKPVQRRILHAMKELDDGRYNKVANVVGHTMQYHPHGDASISDAMVQMGQKDLLIDTQGNWGNILTGDGAAASRYIEARLSKFALDVVFSPKVTEWQLSYDGRKKEPLNLPVKFPLLLAQGAEGIAVGLSTKVLPHNFNELIDACVKYLKGRSFEIYPDFPTGGLIDVSSYNDGVRGGRIRVRAKIFAQNKNTLVISEIPFATNTSSLIDSILKANDKGKIKIKKIDDNTASGVEILVHLPSGVSPDKMTDALYAFTNCEISISPLACVIENDKPVFIGISEILKHSADHTVSILKAELEVELHELNEQWHFASLERIFIENKIYRNIEEENTWEGVIDTIDKGLQPHIKHLKRTVTKEDIVKLTEIQIKRISKFDINRAEQKIEALEERIKAIKNHLENIIDFAINYFTDIKKKYGKGRKRLTEIRLFDNIDATGVVMKNIKLYANKKEGFVGTGLKKDEYICDCSDLDDIIIFTKKGEMMVTKVAEKTFINNDIIHIAVFKKKDRRTIYNMVYKDGCRGYSYIKRFFVNGITRDKVYDLTQGKPQSEVIYFTANPNGEAEIVTVHLRGIKGLKKLKWDVDFSEILTKSRSSKGNILSNYAVKRIDLKRKGISTLKPRNIWFDETILRLNTEGRGRLLGAFSGEDKIVVVTKPGLIKAIEPKLDLRFDSTPVIIEKWHPDCPISVVHYDGIRNRYYAKRFLIGVPDKEEIIITDNNRSKLLWVSLKRHAVIEISYYGTKKSTDKIAIEDLVSVKGVKAIGNQVTTHKIKSIKTIGFPSDDGNKQKNDNKEAK